MGHLIIALIVALLAYFLAQAFIAAPKIVHALIAVVVFLVVYFGTGVIL